MLKGRVGIRVLEGVQAPVLEVTQPRRDTLSAQREQAEDMIAVMRPGDTLTVWKLDRVARSSKPTGRPLLELALRLLDCQPDSFTTDADRDAGTTGRRLVVGLRSCFVQGGVNLGTALVVTPGSGRKSHQPSR